MIKNILCIGLSLGMLKSYSQNVGIGTSTPTKGKLEIVGVAGTGSTNAIFGSSTSGISLQQNWPTIGFNQYRDNTAGTGKFMATGYAAIQYMSPVNGLLVIDMLGTGTANTFTTSGTRGFSINANGNVGLRGDPGDASLYVNRGTATNTVIFQGTTYHSYFNNFTSENTFLRAGKANGMVVINDVPGGIVAMGASTTNTKVGINDWSPTYTLDILQADDQGLALVSDEGNVWELFNANLPFFFKYNENPLAFIDWTDGRWAQVSDARLKKDVAPLTGVLEKIGQLKPVSYHMKNEITGSSRRIGFIAQEVKKLFPEIVTVNPPGHEHEKIADLHMIDYTSFGVLAIQAIKEQQERILELENRIRALEERAGKGN